MGKNHGTKKVAFDFSSLAGTWVGGLGIVYDCCCDVVTSLCHTEYSFDILTHWEMFEFGNNVKMSRS